MGNLFIRSMSLSVAFMLCIFLCDAIAGLGQGRAADTSNEAYFAVSRNLQCSSGMCEHELVIVNANSLTIRRTLNIVTPHQIDSISWSPSHDLLTFLSLDRLHFYDLGRDLHLESLIPSSFRFFKQVQWSKTGSQIAWIEYWVNLDRNEHSTTLFIMDLLNRRITKTLISRRRSDYSVSPSWFEQENKLLLTIPSYSQLSSEGVPVDSEEIVWLDWMEEQFHRIGPEEIVGRYPSLSSDNSKVVFSTTRWQETMQVAYYDMITDVPAVQISNIEGNKFDPLWVLDDRAILFQAANAGFSRFMLYSLDDHDLIRLPTMAHVFKFDVSPDRANFAYVGMDELGNLALCVMSLETFVQHCAFDPGLSGQSVVAWNR